jgi:hypothetical protein
MGDEPTGNIVIHLDNTIAHYEEDGNRVGTTVFTLDHGSTIFSREDQWILNHENAAPEVVTVSEDGQAMSLSENVYNGFKARIHAHAECRVLPQNLSM